MDPEILFKPSHLINRASRLLARRGEAQFHALGLAVAQIPVFGALKTGNSLSQKELARLAQIEQPTMAQLLARMERDGLIQRTPDPNDKRSSLISLTPKAMKKLPRARTLLLEGNNRALQGFTEEEIAALSQLLLRIVRNLDPSDTGIETGLLR